MEELKAKVEALKKRALEDKAAIAALKDTNDALAAQLQQKGPS